MGPDPLLFKVSSPFPQELESYPLDGNLPQGGSFTNLATLSVHASETTYKGML